MTSMGEIADEGAEQYENHLAEQRLARAKRGKALRNKRPDRGEKLLDREGREVTVQGSYREEGVWFAVIEYDDGYCPWPVGGRVGGTDEHPLWEHRVANGKVVRGGGDYYNPADWETEGGLRTRPD